jgi:UDP-N-acetylglucosamine 2-epimerase (non-hydrolysing)
MKIITVVGARPNFMKAAPILTAIRAHNEGAARPGPSSDAAREPISHVLVHTGQHYDERMSTNIFTDLGLAKPDVWLGVGSGSHAVQTAAVMTAFESVVTTEKPDVVIVVGDVNSTVACALVTAKVAFGAAGARPLVAHVEAGLRSFDRTMPEEVNRIVTDQLSDLLFVTEESGLRNLQNEGVDGEKVHFVGNTMIDSLLACQARADASTILDELGLRRDGSSSPRDYALLTLHRPANVDDRHAFTNILNGLQDVASEQPIVFPVHPRTRARIKQFGIDLPVHDSASGSAGWSAGIRLVDPLGYLDFVSMMKNARLVVTDSGGIQEETTCLGVPCVTVRDNTERPITVTRGTNVIAGTAAPGIRSAIRAQLRRRAAAVVPEKWDGNAAARIIDILLDVHCARAVSAQRIASSF